MKSKLHLTKEGLDNILLIKSKMSIPCPGPPTIRIQPAAPADLLVLHFSTSLRNATNSLPHTVPLATITDTLAQFSGDPTIDKGDEDAWGMPVVDRKLNKIIGYGTMIEEISTLIHRGRFGMDGLCCWLEVGFASKKNAGYRVGGGPGGRKLRRRG
jgi:hypothetical protein